MPAVTGQPVRYAQGWNSAYFQPQEEITEAEARRRHLAQEPYAALIGGTREHPDIAIDLELKVGEVEVFFLQPDSRPTCTYLFVEQEPGRLWLEQTTVLTWDGERRESFEWHVMRPNGMRHVEKGVYGEDTKDVAERVVPPEEMAELDFLWEPVPRFGDYTSIARFERDRPDAQS